MEKQRRLRTWLVNIINSGKVEGLEWINEEKTMFKIPWKHESRNDWQPSHAQIFTEWARFTGKFVEGRDKPDFKMFKTRLRCAFNKAPDIEELPDLRKYKGVNPYRVYQLLKKDKKVSSPARSRQNNTDDKSGFSDYTRPAIDARAALRSKLIKNESLSGVGGGGSGGRGGGYHGLPSHVESLSSGLGGDYSYGGMVAGSGSRGVTDDDDSVMVSSDIEVEVESTDQGLYKMTPQSYQHNHEFFTPTDDKTRLTEHVRHSLQMPMPVAMETQASALYSGHTPGDTLFKAEPRNDVKSRPQDNLSHQPASQQPSPATQYPGSRPPLPAASQSSSQGNTPEVTSPSVRVTSPEAQSLVLLQSTRYRLTVLKNLHGLHKEGILCDLLLRASDGNVIPVHANVMCASSQFFKKKVDHWEVGHSGDTVDSCMTIEFADIPFEVLNSIIQFIYVGEFEIARGSLPIVATAARHMQLEDLIILCDHVLDALAGQTKQSSQAQSAASRSHASPIPTHITQMHNSQPVNGFSTLGTHSTAYSTSPATSQSISQSAPSSASHVVRSTAASTNQNAAGRAAPSGGSYQDNWQLPMGMGRLAKGDKAEASGAQNPLDVLCQAVHEKIRSDSHHTAAQHNKTELTRQTSDQSYSPPALTISMPSYSMPTSTSVTFPAARPGGSHPATPANSRGHHPNMPLTTLATVALSSTNGMAVGSQRGASIPGSKVLSSPARSAAPYPGKNSTAVATPQNTTVSRQLVVQAPPSSAPTAAGRSAALGTHSQYLGTAPQSAAPLPLGPPQLAPHRPLVAAQSALATGASGAGAKQALTDASSPPPPRRRRPSSCNRELKAEEDSLVQQHIQRIKSQVPETERVSNRGPAAAKLLKEPRTVAGAAMYECELCSKNFTGKTALLEHKRGCSGAPPRRSHPGVSEVTGVSDVTCGQCGKPFRSSAALRKHELWHEARRRLTCATCGKVCKSALLLKHHRKQHLNNKGFRCDTCSKTFITRATLKTHIVSKHIKQRTTEQSDASAPPTPSSELPERRRCLFCTTVMTSHEGMVAHLQTHPEWTQFAAQHSPEQLLRAAPFNCLPNHYTTGCDARNSQDLSRQESAARFEAPASRYWEKRPSVELAEEVSRARFDEECRTGFEAHATGFGEERCGANFDDPGARYEDGGAGYGAGVREPGEERGEEDEERDSDAVTLLTCPSCPAEFSQDYELEQHYAAEHENELDEAANDDVTMTSAEIEQPRPVEIQPYRHNCNNCPEGFHDSLALQEHIRVQHSWSEQAPSSKRGRGSREPAATHQPPVTRGRRRRGRPAQHGPYAGDRGGISSRDFSPHSFGLPGPGGYLSFAPAVVDLGPPPLMRMSESWQDARLGGSEAREAHRQGEDSGDSGEDISLATAVRGSRWRYKSSHEGESATPVNIVRPTVPGEHMASREACALHAEIRPDGRHMKDGNFKEGPSHVTLLRSALNQPPLQHWLPPPARSLPLTALNPTPAQHYERSGLVVKPVAPHGPGFDASLDRRPVELISRLTSPRHHPTILSPMAQSPGRPSATYPAAGSLAPPLPTASAAGLVVAQLSDSGVPRLTSGPRAVQLNPADNPTRDCFKSPNHFTFPATPPGMFARMRSSHAPPEPTPPAELFSPNASEPLRLEQHGATQRAGTQLGLTQHGATPASSAHFSPQPRAPLVVPLPPELMLWFAAPRLPLAPNLPGQPLVVPPCYPPPAFPPSPVKQVDMTYSHPGDSKPTHQRENAMDLTKLRQHTDEGAGFPVRHNSWLISK